MISLQWICALTLAFICCLTAQPVKRDIELGDLIPEFLKAVNSTNLCLDPGAIYYTPTNVNDTCSLSALNCSVNELKVLYHDCFDEPDEETQDTYDNLLTQLAVDQTDSSCSKQMFTCEKSPKKPFEEFLENIKSLVQQINSKGSRPQL